MLKSLSLRNWEAHENLELQFSPNLNVIVGPSNTGKSAVIRAINAILTGTIRPKGKTHGDGSVRRGSSEATVALTTDKGQVTVTRALSGNKASTSWSIRVGRGGTVTYSALRGSVPPELPQILNIAMVELDGNRFSPAIHMQGDGLFLLESTGALRTTSGIATKVIDALARMQEVGPFTDMVRRFLRSARSEAKKAREQIKQLEEELAEVDIELAQHAESIAASLSNLGQEKAKSDQLLVQARSIRERSVRAKAELDCLKSAIARARPLAQAASRSCEQLKSKAQQLAKARSIMARAAQIQHEIDKIDISSVRTIQRKLKSLQALLQKTAHDLDVGRKLADVGQHRSEADRASMAKVVLSRADQLVMDYSQANFEQWQAEEIKRQIEEAIRERESAIQSIKRSRSRLAELKKQLKGKCPTCGQNAPHLWE